MNAILAAFPFFVAVLLFGCGSGCGTLGVANTSPCDNRTSSATSTTAPTFNMTGTVSGAQLQGVKISLTGAATTSTTTSTSGNYTFTALPTGSYTVVPSLSGSTFNPVSNIVTISGANVTVDNFAETINTLGTFSISGTVSGAAGTAVQNVVITLSALSGVNTGSALTDPNGHYSFSGLAAGTGTITVTPFLAGHTFSPTSTPVITTTAGTAATIDFAEAAL